MNIKNGVRESELIKDEKVDIQSKPCMQKACKNVYLCIPYSDNIYSKGTALLSVLQPAYITGSKAKFFVFSTRMREINKGVSSLLKNKRKERKNKRIRDRGETIG